MGSQPITHIVSISGGITLPVPQHEKFQLSKSSFRQFRQRVKIAGDTIYLYEDIVIDHKPQWIQYNEARYKLLQRFWRKLGAV